eukprot:6017163-Amphidinium_carterae.4
MPTRAVKVIWDHIDALLPLHGVVFHHTSSPVHPDADRTCGVESALVAASVFEFFVQFVPILLEFEAHAF